MGSQGVGLSQQGRALGRPDPAPLFSFRVEVRPEPLFLKGRIMAFMLLSRRLACTFHHNYRLLAPSKPGGLGKNWS